MIFSTRVPIDLFSLLRSYGNIILIKEVLETKTKNKKQQPVQGKLVHCITKVSWHNDIIANINHIIENACSKVICYKENSDW